MRFCRLTAQVVALSCLAIALGVALTLASCGTILQLDDDLVDGGATMDGGDGSTFEGGRSSDGAVDAAACAANLMIDPSNCGACARSCGAGGRCSGGLCAPETIPILKESLPLGADAHLVTRGDAGAAFTDDRALSSDLGTLGTVYTFDPAAPQPSVRAVETSQDHPSHVALPFNNLFWVKTGVGPFTDVSRKDTVVDIPGGSITSLATSPSGKLIAILESETDPSNKPTVVLHFYKPDLTATNVADLTFATDLPHALALGADDAAILALDKSVVRVTLGATVATTVVTLPQSTILDVVVFQDIVFLSTTGGEIFSASLGSDGTIKSIFTGFSTARSLKVDETGTLYVLDMAGIHTTKYGAPLLVVADTASTPTPGILSFASSAGWIYYLTANGLFRVHA